MTSYMHYADAYPFAKQRQAFLIDQATQGHEQDEALRQTLAALKERRRFFRMYQLRSFFFRLAPNVALRRIQ